MRITGAGAYDVQKKIIEANLPLGGAIRNALVGATSRLRDVRIEVGGTGVTQHQFGFRTRREPIFYSPHEIIALLFQIDGKGLAFATLFGSDRVKLTSLEGSDIIPEQNKLVAFIGLNQSRESFLHFNEDPRLDSDLVKRAVDSGEGANVTSITMGIPDLGNFKAVPLPLIRQRGPHNAPFWDLTQIDTINQLTWKNSVICAGSLIPSYAQAAGIDPLSVPDRIMYVAEALANESLGVAQTLDLGRDSISGRIANLQW